MLNINFIDRISQYFASLKTGNDLVTENQRKLYNFALLRLGQNRTATTYIVKYQLVSPISHLITVLRNSWGKYNDFSPLQITIDQ